MERAVMEEGLLNTPRLGPSPPHVALFIVSPRCRVRRRCRYRARQTRIDAARRETLAGGAVRPGAGTTGRGRNGTGAAAIVCPDAGRQPHSFIWCRPYAASGRRRDLCHLRCFGSAGNTGRSGGPACRGRSGPCPLSG